MVMIGKQGNMNNLPKEAVKYPASQFFKTRLQKYLLGMV